MTAKDLQKEIIKTYLKPTLKSYGYQTAGQTWWKNMGNFYTVINLQNFSWNNKDEITFCFNIGIALSDRIKDPSKKKITYFDILSHQRDSAFVPADRLEHKFKTKTGYILTAGVNAEEFINEMKIDFEKGILPLLDSLKTIQDWANFHERFPRGEKVKQYLMDNYFQKQNEF